MLCGSFDFSRRILQFDVTFPKMPCSWISVDAMDVSGDVHLDVDDHNVFKQRLDATGRVLEQHDPVRHEVGPSEVLPATKTADAGATNGAPGCGSCYGAEDEARKCCNTCAEVREAYRSKGWALTRLDHVEQCKGEGYTEEIAAQQGEGCRVWGDMAINKVAGNVHIAPGKSLQQGAMHIHDLAVFAGKEAFDFSHTIKKWAFGREYPVSVSVEIRVVQQDGGFVDMLKGCDLEMSALGKRGCVSINVFTGALSL